MIEFKLKLLQICAELSPNCYDECQVFWYLDNSASFMVSFSLLHNNVDMFFLT